MVASLILKVFEKGASMLLSRRFLASLGGAVVILLKDELGLDEETAKQIVTFVVAWVLGDSIRVTK